MIALRYEETTQAKVPIPITVAPPSRSPPVEEHPAFRSVTPSIDQRQGQGQVGQGREEEWKRDSGVANTTSTGRSSNFGGGSLKGTVEEREEREDRVQEEVFSGDREGGKMAMVAEPSSPVRTTPSRAQQNGKGEMLRQDVQDQRDVRIELPETPRVENANTPDDFTPITTPIPTDNLFGENFMDGLSFSNRGSVMFGGKKAVERPNPQARVTGGRR